MPRAYWIWIVLNACAVLGETLNEKKSEAFVTLLYGNGYSLAALVMFQSLIETKTQRELVAVITPDVSNKTRAKLENLNVVCIEIPVMRNPYEGQSRYNSRFDSVMSKLYIWNLTQYETIVFLDADTLIFDNIDELFQCGEFCAAFLNPTTFNSGVLVLKPNKKVLEDMLEKAGTGAIRSYDGGDQGFLNSYYPQLIRAPMFEPSKEDPSHFKRLSSVHHTDHILYYPRLRWDILEPKIIQFVGVPGLKPWLWWSYPLMDLSSLWLQYRQRLPLDSSDSRADLWEAFCLFVGGIVLLSGAVHVSLKQGFRIKKWTCQILGNKPWIQESQLSDNTVSLFFGSVGVFFFIVACYFGFLMIPSNMPPYYAWPLFLLWTYSALYLMFGTFCWIMKAKMEEKHGEIRHSTNTYLVWGYSLFAFTVGCIAATFKRELFQDIFTKIGFLLFLVFLIVWVHFMILSRIAFLWYIGETPTNKALYGSNMVIVAVAATLSPGLYLFS